MIEISSGNGWMLSHGGEPHASITSAVLPKLIYQEEEVWIGKCRATLFTTVKNWKLVPVSISKERIYT